MTEALAIQIITALIGDMPTIVADVKSLIASIEGQSTQAAAPITPGIVSEDASLVAQLTLAQART
jgi:hypothetical protein